jgi:hypothetical protein
MVSGGEGVIDLVDEREWKGWAWGVEGGVGTGCVWDGIVDRG